MVKFKLLILGTSLVLSTMFFSFLLFAKVPYSKVKNIKVAHFWPQVKVFNKTSFTAHVKVTYALCKNDVFDIAPGATGTGKSTLARAGCLVTKIEATFEGNATASVTSITNYSSTGTGAADFTIAENAINDDESTFECLVYKSDKEGLPLGVPPGFVIQNNTNRSIYITFIGAGMNNNKVFELIKSGMTREFRLGSGWWSFNVLFPTNDSEVGDYFIRKYDQYSGAPEIFSKATEKPKYEISGHFEKVQDKKYCINVIGGPIFIKKTNSVGDNNMSKNALKVTTINEGLNCHEISRYGRMF